ncbi:o-succinylbenzoate synthase [Halorhabdus amylolytica]|uniref:o-succinylbenzoate synthase n=1 Tax=Halorhabdus amylolytica TaxID=2559573 RepID=UPI0010AA1473|nr:o-succinylbenzoate synthase [Halorhabdus amylolytica]
MKVEPFSLSLSEPLATAAGDIGSREGFLVTLQDDEVRGVGEATPLAGWTESFEECERALRAVANGDRDRAELDPTETPAAAHAVELAHADLAARERAVPLAEWLAEGYRTSVPVNATIGDAEVEAAAEAARNAVEDGFETVKVKVGVRSVEADLERVRAVREAVGDIDLRVDANGAWSRPEATRAIEGLTDLSVSYVEQPLAADDLTGHAALRDRGVGIALDESLPERGVDSILETDAADGLVLKPMALGGVHRAREIALRARDRGVDPVVTTTIDGAVARTAALHLAASLGIERACGLATADRLAADLAVDPAPVKDGRMSLPDAPGIGVDIGIR